MNITPEQIRKTVLLFILGCTLMSVVFYAANPDLMGYDPEDPMLFVMQKLTAAAIIGFGVIFAGILSKRN